MGKIRSLFLNKWTQKIHRRKDRGKGVSLSDEELLKIVEELFKMMKKKQYLKKTLKQLSETIGDISLRIDLMGAPELSFILDIAKGKLNFLKEKRYANVGVAFHKAFFINFIKKPPKQNQAHILLNNMVIRKGEVKVFQCLGVLFFGSLIEGLCSDLNNARTEIAKLRTK